jgi:hypothetical protein
VLHIVIDSVPVSKLLVISALATAKPRAEAETKMDSEIFDTFEAFYAYRLYVASILLLLIVGNCGNRKLIFHTRRLTAASPAYHNASPPERHCFFLS